MRWLGQGSRPAATSSAALATGIGESPCVLRLHPGEPASTHRVLVQTEQGVRREFEALGLDFDRAETVAPVVDFTPAPAISNFTFHHGDQFPAWEDDLLVGSLRAQTLYRLRIREGSLVDQEKLVTGLGRIRDVEMGFDGLVYVLLENREGGTLVRLTPIPPN